MHMRSSGSNRPLLLVTAGLVAVAAIVAAILASSGGGGGSRTAARLGTSSADRGFSRAYEEAARKALPSVVQIQSGGKLGSGVVFNGSGDIVTNAHVVAGSRTFQVITSDGKQHSGTLQGTFPAGDLAVVHIDGGNLTPARLGDSSKLKVGEAVLALGSPLGLRSSVTNGIVSAVSRTVSEGNGVALSSVVQTSAPINPGNSGGALVNLSAEVVGIPTLAAVDPELGGTAPGVGFAISSNNVEAIAGQLVDQGHVTSSGRAYLGVELRSLQSGGALIVGVVRGGPADDAGLNPGDVIVSVAGRPVASADDVAVALAQHRPGEKVPVKVVHQDGSTATVQVKLGELPAGG